MSGSRERPESNPLEIPSLPTLVGLQEEAATTISTYVGDQIGDLYLSGRKVKIEANPESFYLTFNDSDKSAIIFSKQAMQTTRYDIESKYSLSYVLKNDDLSSRTVSYRFDSGRGVKTYRNGQTNDDPSEMQEEDFLKVRNMLKDINDYFLPLIPS